MRKTVNTLAALILGGIIGGLVTWGLLTPTDSEAPVVVVPLPPVSQRLPACEFEDSVSCVWDNATRGVNRVPLDSAQRYIVNGPQER